MFLSLQAGRAVAALLVVLFHLGGTFAQAKYFGYDGFDHLFGWADAGVDFFFVLSGFLITSAHRKDFGRPRTLGSYVSKRLLRIYPTYWIVCAAVSLAALAVPSLRQALPSDPLVFIKGLALIPQGAAVAGATGSPILFVAWSLQYELLFYAIVAVLIANRAAGLLLAAGVVAVQLGCQLSGGCAFPVSFISAGSFIYLFAIGVLAAYAVDSRLRVERPLAIGLLGLAGFFAFGAFEMWQGRDGLSVDRRLVYAACAGLAIFGLARAERGGRLVLRQRWIAVLGDASYSLYLLHAPIISVLIRLLKAVHIDRAGLPGLVAGFVFVVLCCVGASVAFYLAIERPMLKRFRRRVGAKAPLPSHGAEPLGAAHGAEPLGASARLQ